MAVKPKNPLADFNLNSIILLAATAYVGWQVTTSLTTNKETRDSVGKIETTLPFVTKSQDRLEAEVKEVKDDVKEAKERMVTRDELNNKHTRLLDSINEVKSEQDRLKEKK